MNFLNTGDVGGKLSAGKSVSYQESGIKRHMISHLQHQNWEDKETCIQKSEGKLFTIKIYSWPRNQSKLWVE